ncbi:hypothetical protein DY052_07545 [Apilactobacillus timberlakei]|uniref:hypothetical protein n=1 Tax=Apilactobacillus timberlakei TaxID=2008380 RepID=UPI00112D5A7A|nr:hypothetical protein [Apilactobacillus timberlakei]TPR13707.1 hypothetical protein DY052_07545 [Apilactobacillus timberlakei]
MGIEQILLSWFIFIYFLVGLVYGKRFLKMIIRLALKRSSKNPIETYPLMMFTACFCINIFGLWIMSSIASVLWIIVLYHSSFIFRFLIYIQ